jgi:RNA polymerase sigma-70 factor (ECF subfamily)
MPQSPPESDRELLARAGSDPEAFGELFDRHFDSIFGYLLRRTGDWDLSRDLSSEVFLQALRHRWRFKWRGVPVSAWLYTIATNQLRMHYRGRIRATRLLDRLTHENVLERTDSAAIQDERSAWLRDRNQAEEFERVRQAMATLPLAEQEVLALRFFEQKQSSEIAQILGKREGTVRSLLSRGLARLRGLLGPQQNPTGGIE